MQEKKSSLTMNKRKIPFFIEKGCNEIINQPSQKYKVNLLYLPIKQFCLLISTFSQNNFTDIRNVRILNIIARE